MEIKEYVNLRKLEMKSLVESLKVKPSLLIIQLNEDEASKAYIRGKLKDSEEVGINAELLKLDVNTSEEELLKVIDECNKNPKYHGIIVQMPLPKQINEEHVKVAVSPIKDVDGFNPLSNLFPCTPYGIIKYLEYLNTEFVGKNAVVIGRSNIVGKPMAKLLLSKSCNVTVLHSKTSDEDKKFYLKHADIIVVAVGKKWFLNGYELKESAIVVDVGINREDGKLYGDCAPELKVKLQTPVPGGVGLLTRLTLLDNLLEAYKEQVK